MIRGLLEFTAVLLALLALAGLGGALDERLDLLANFRLHLAVAAVAVMLLAGWVRAGPALWSAALALGICLPGLGPVLNAPDGPGPGREIVLVTANLSANNPDQGAARAALLALEPDILVTAETLPAFLGDGAALAAAFPHRVLRAEGRFRRVALWSRWPLAGPRLHLDNSWTPTAAQAVVEIPGEAPLALVGVHLSQPVEGLQQRQARGLAGIAARLPRPLVIAGDFNATPWTRAMELVLDGTGTRLAGGWQATWVGRYPTPFGTVQAPVGQWIDHVLVSPQIRVVAVETHAIPGSDHRAVRARLRLPPTAAGQSSLSLGQNRDGRG